MTDKFDGVIYIQPSNEIPSDFSSGEITRSLTKIKSSLAKIIDVLDQNINDRLETAFDFLDTEDGLRLQIQLLETLVEAYRKRYGPLNFDPGMPKEIVERRKRVTKLFDDGYTIQQMALALHYSEKTIDRDLKVMNLQKKHKKDVPNVTLQHKK